MADIYTPSWYEEVKVAINKKVSQLKDIPEGKWNLAIEIVGDGMSPYVQDNGERHFLVAIDNGSCLWYKEIASDSDGSEIGKLDYRFRGLASVFDSIAAGVLDPIDAALDGSIKVRGDMRFLLRQADQVQALLEAYAKEVTTDWPKGRPPYGNSVEIDPVGEAVSNA
ncbi:MAG: hypothetical protein HKL80_05770 [Acidimicrobiales bacterium]|nr:hypothetical protein [Acidimicrobiales bacterium]